MAARGDADIKVLRVVLIGKTGAGKSSLGNALTGLKEVRVARGEQRKEDVSRRSSTEGFGVGRGLKSCTKYCDWKKKERMGIVMEVTDTPGLCDTSLDEETIYKEVAKSVAVSEPGPHVIIFVIRCDRFTKEERDVYIKLKRLFSEEMNKYLLIVFTWLDSLRSREAEPIEILREILAEDIGQLGEAMQSMMVDAGNRYLGMSLKEPDLDSQILDLINMMKVMVKRNGHGYYRSGLSDQIMEKVEELVEEEAKKKQMDRSQVIADVKKDIISENVQPGFLGSLKRIVSTFASGLWNNLCSVM